MPVIFRPIHHILDGYLNGLGYLSSKYLVINGNKSVFTKAYSKLISSNMKYAVLFNENLFLAS